MTTILHLGCGRIEPVQNAGANIITLDADAMLNPMLVCELGIDPIPLANDSVDLAIAEHVLEHIGRQGDTAEWFFFWEELYRVLKPSGQLRFLSPLYSSVWAWSDPSHTRALSPESFTFFNQDAYRIEGSSISPFRIRCDFKPHHFNTEYADGSFSGWLTVRKPLVPWWEILDTAEAESYRKGTIHAV